MGKRIAKTLKFKDGSRLVRYSDGSKKKFGPPKSKKKTGTLSKGTCHVKAHTRSCMKRS